MPKKKEILNKEDLGEDWCFECKDGGRLRICDYGDCLKAYHHECMASKAKQFTCARHKCNQCGKASSFYCYCCPRAVCRRCIRSAEFVRVRGEKGFCDHCLKLALLVEEKKDVDSDGETKINFNDRDTYETLYKEYWEILNSSEKLTLEDLKSAKAQLKLGKNYNSDDYDDNSDEYYVSDYEDKDDMELNDRGRKRKRNKAEPTGMKGKINSNKKEFIGWGSKSVMQFLTAIGKDTTQSLSQRQLETIIKGYIKENKLLLEKKTVECDVNLQSLLGRKRVKLNRIYDLLKSHLKVNKESSDEEEIGYDSEKYYDGKVVYGRKRKDTADKILEKEENIPRFHFAAIIPKNIRLVYLRKTLVQKLMKETETFESKVIGSFVRVKADAIGCFPKGSYQLMQVTGIRKCLVGENDQNLLLQASDMDICITSLSEDDFTEEECQDLRSKYKAGQLKKLTVVALEQKARSLHEDIIKHWIPRELNLLKHRIDQANEKGWRKELFEYLERRQFLQNPSNQSKLLQDTPIVDPDVEDVGPVEEDIENDEGNKNSPESIPMHTSEKSIVANRISSAINADGERQELRENSPSKVTEEGRKHNEHASIEEETTCKTETFDIEGKLSTCSVALGPDKRQNKSTSSVVKDQADYSFSDVGRLGNAKSQRLIDLSSDDDDDDDDANKSTIHLSKEELEDTESSLWYVTSSHSEKLGPVSLSVLKNWSKEFNTASESKIYKAGQSEEQAIPLTAVMHLAFPRR